MTGWRKRTVYELIEANGLNLHGDIEHFAELVRADEREACAKVVEDDMLADEIQQAITAIKQALAQPAPVQEPVVFYRCNGCGHAYEQVHPTSCDCMEGEGFDRVEFYTTSPAQPEPVHEPVAWVEYETGNNTKRPQNCGTGYCSCVECVMEPAQQEPVAWAMYQKGRLQSFWMDKGDAFDFEFTSEHSWAPLYTTPPQRTWVGLTDEEKHEIELKAGITEDDDGYIVFQVFRLIEAKLKEKNFD